MSNDLLIHATGLAALALNVVALVCTCERRLRVRSGIAGMAWALNNFLLGAHAAAALSVVSAGRTATSAATLHRAANRSSSPLDSIHPSTAPSLRIARFQNGARVLR